MCRSEQGINVDNFIVIVDNLKDWRPYYPTDQLVLVKDYLFDETFQEKKGLQIINLCQSLKYLSLGYYCSLIAEARGHKVTPNIKTINDLSKKSLYIYDLNDLDGIKEELAPHNRGSGKDVSFRVFFGKTLFVEYQELARQIFEYYPCPLLEVSLSYKETWQIKKITPFGIRGLSNQEEDFFATSLDQYSNKIWRLPKTREAYSYDLAILVNPLEEIPPSDSRALQNFKLACDKRKVYCEFINRKDFSRISEFDMLFIRETTSLRNHTYRFSKKAEDEGLVVLDDPKSILKCTNKIFLTNLFDRLGVKSIPGRFVSDCNDEVVDALIKSFGLPLVIKIPDGSFSVGVKKAEDKDSLKLILSEMLKKTDLILVQKFLYTPYDWRIGVLGNEALFACKYYMSENHWQIYNHEVGLDDSKFSGEAQACKIEDVPSGVLQQALRAVQKIGNGFYGVDIKESQGGEIYVVEVNDNPNIDSGVEDQVYGMDLYLKIIDWFIERAKYNQKSV